MGGDPGCADVDHELRACAVVGIISARARDASGIGAHARDATSETCAAAAIIGGEWCTHDVVIRLGGRTARESSFPQCRNDRRVTQRARP